MAFTINYKYGMTPDEIRQYWPNLNLKRFHFTSIRTPAYNCLAWAIGDDVTWMDMYYFKEVYNLEIKNLDHSVHGYAECLKKYYRFEICNNGDIERGKEKIVLYENNEKDFAHIARQLPNGNWTSKMGRLEDIEHYSVEALSGEFYGKPVLYMQRERITK